MIGKFIRSLFGIPKRDNKNFKKDFINIVNSCDKNQNNIDKELPKDTLESFERLDNQNNDLITGYIYYATLDNFCCPECWPLDKVVFPYDKNKCPKLPRHQGCRCILVPKMKTFRELGLNINEFSEFERSWTIRELQTTYKNNPNKKLKHPKSTILQFGKIDGSAEEWVRTLPNELQKNFFKSELAYQLWKDGIIKAIDLVNPQTWALRSDEELRNIL